MAFAAPLSGCVWPSESDYRDRLSLVTSATAPDSVAAGAAFDVLISTWGPDGCWRKGSDRIHQKGPLQSYILPSDREHVGRGGICTDNIVNFQHTVRMPAHLRGEMEVTVIRRLLTASGADSSGTILLKIQVI